jgi:LmbE family N-acetylglucosaminyl deacetylase
MTQHVYLSPHLDDAVFSCGGLIAKQIAAGDSVIVITVCAGDPPAGLLSDFARALHMVWHAAGPPVPARREEDLAACKRLGAEAIHLEIPDAIYRLDSSAEALYPSLFEVFGPLNTGESDLPQELGRSLSSRLTADASVYVPQAIGGHVDHRLTRLAAEGLDRSLFYYRDMPYAFRDGVLPPDLAQPHGSEHALALTEDEIDAWNAALLEYRSQISSYWAGDHEVREELQAYHDAHGGIILIKTNP